MRIDRGYVLRMVRISSVIYVLGAVLDNLLTYRYVVLERVFVEANPLAVERVYTAPLWLWFVEDFAVYLAVLAMVCGYCRLCLYAARRKPSKREWFIKEARVSWWILVAAAIMRLLPVVHNTLVLLFGIETPFSTAVQIVGHFIKNLLSL